MRVLLYVIIRIKGGGKLGIGNPAAGKVNRVSKESKVSKTSKVIKTSKKSKVSQTR
jgi:hypothetical protein